MHLEIITPEKKIFAGEATAVQFPGQDGSFQILNDHAPIISSLAESNNVHHVQLSPRNQQVDNSLFYDATHLNQKGGDFFSPVLDSILLQY